MTTTSSLRLLFGSAALCVAGAAGAQVSGAIFTTTPDGAIVNENVHWTWCAIAASSSAAAAT
jgi:hypothetical protein